MTDENQPKSKQVSSGEWVSLHRAEDCEECTGRGWRWECEEWGGCSNTFCPQIVCEACQRKPYCMCSKYPPHTVNCPLEKAMARVQYGPPNYPPETPLVMAVPIGNCSFDRFNDEPQPVWRAMRV